jgi:FixJ family two-component response regulator
VEYERVMKMPLIAIVDDDPSVREALDALLRSVGYDAEAFASGEAFLSSQLVDRVACVIVDMHMPGITGLEVLVRLVASGKPVSTILITAYPDDGVRAAALAAGATAYLCKPFSHDELIRCLHAKSRVGDAEGTAS